ncbi:MAG: molybdopterin-dependent oxidoreductase, partial [Rhodospirillaceae bacterium]|nr:molybdopterin-dependent oxidoreductase [Rhodospirillaceae bacterium]
ENLYNEGQAMLLADYIEQGRIKALVSYGTNLMMWPNSNRLAEALKKLEVFSVCDFFDNPTVDAATVFLPAATHLERQSLIMALNGRVQYRPAAVAPRGQARGDTEMMFKLADALGLHNQFWGGDIKASFEERLSSTELDFADLPENGKSINLKLAEIPEKNYQTVGFKTPSGKIEFDSARLRAEGHDGLPTYKEPYWSPAGSPEIAADYPLVLSTGIRGKTYSHSQGRQLETLRVREPEPRAQINPEDAAERGIQDGDRMEIASPLGRIEVTAWVTDAILKGVVHAPHGWAEANCNALIPDGEALDPITGYPPFKSSLCQVTRA